VPLQHDAATSYPQNSQTFETNFMYHWQNTSLKANQSHSTLSGHILRKQLKCIRHPRQAVQQAACGRTTGRACCFFAQTDSLQRTQEKTAEHASSSSSPAIPRDARECCSACEGA
jgi:hypothetical protein